VQVSSVRSLASLQYSLQYFSFPETVQLQAGCPHFLAFSSAIVLLHKTKFNPENRQCQSVCPCDKIIESTAYVLQSIGVSFDFSYLGLFVHISSK
jgi:hypothetical protein